MIGSSFINRIPTITKNLIIINILVWLAMLILPNKLGVDIMGNFAFFPFESPLFKPFQLISYMFMHSTDQMGHLFFNMFALFMFGSVLERVLGAKRYLFFYLSAGIGAALIQGGIYAIWIENLTDKLNLFQSGMLKIPMDQAQSMAYQLYGLMNSPTIGASGAIYGVLLAFGMIFPNMPLYIFFIPVPVKAKWVVLAYGAIELFLGISGLQSGVAHFAHLGGMVVGFFIILYWKKKGLFNGLYY